MLKTIMLAVSMAMTVGIYVPLFRRVFKRKHTRDFSKTSQLFITLVQLNNLGLAVAEKAPYLVAWYCVQVVLTGLNLALIHYFWNFEEPRNRKKGRPR